MSTPKKIRFSILRYPKLLICGLLSACLMYAYVTANPPGYCEAQKRVIPDEEICANLFDGAIKKGYLQLGASEKTGHDYFMNHRSYCHIDKSAMARFHRDGLLTALFWDNIEGSLIYKMTDEGKKYWKSYGAESHALWGALMLLTPCGEITQLHTEMSD